MGGRSVVRPRGGLCGEEGHYLRHSASCVSSLQQTPRRLLPPDVAPGDNPADLVAALYIVASWFDACDSQALVVVDRSIPIILALVGTPTVFAGRRHLERRDRVQGEIPESNALAVLSRP